MKSQHVLIHFHTSVSSDNMKMKLNKKKEKNQITC